MNKFVRNFLLAGLIIFVVSPICFAKTYKVVIEAMTEYSTKNPSKTFIAKVNDFYYFENQQRLEKNSEFDLEVIKVVFPKRGKLNASFQAKINSFTVPSEKRTINVTNPEAIVKISQYKELDIKETAKDAGTSAAGFFVKNISYPINFARGFIEADEGESRLKSATQTMYKKSVFSYVEEGEHLELKKGDLAVMSFSLED